MKKLRLILTGLFSFLIITTSYSQAKVLDSMSLEFELPSYVRGEYLSGSFQHFNNMKSISSDSLVFIYGDKFHKSSSGQIIPAYYFITKEIVIEMKKVSIHHVKDNLYRLDLLFLRPLKSVLWIDLINGGTGQVRASFRLQITRPIIFDS